MKNVIACIGALAITGVSHAAPTPIGFDVNAGGGATFQRFDINLNNDAINYLDAPGGDTFVVFDASIGGAGDAYDGAFEIGVDVGAAQAFTITDDDGVVDVTTGPSGTRIAIDAVADGVITPPSGFSYASEYFVFNTEPLLRVVFSVTNNTGADANVQVETGSDSGTGTGFTFASTGSGDTALGADDTYYVIRDTIDSDPVQSYTQFGVGAPVTPSMAGRFNDDTSVLFDLSLAAGETQSLMFFAAVTDPNSPTAVADALALITQLDGTLNELDALGFLDGLDPAVQSTIVNYAVPAPGALPMLVLSGLATARRRR
ncbi:MAG: hypothetical protein AAGI30_12775 [Planctomycetota bacterium]